MIFTALLLAIAWAIDLLTTSVLGNWAFVAACLIGVAPVARRAFAALRLGQAFTIESLMTVAAIGALFINAAQEAALVVFLFALGEALEGVARGDAKTSKLVGRRIEQIKVPKGSAIGAIVRGQGVDCQVLMPHHDTVIQTDDHIIIFIPEKRDVRQVEKLFQVSATFFG